MLATARPELGDGASASLSCRASGAPSITLDALECSCESEGASCRGSPRTLIEKGLDERDGRAASPQREWQSAVPRRDGSDARSTRSRSTRPSLESLPVPESLGGARRRASRPALPPEERRLAQHSSVAGTIFWSGAAACLDDQTRAARRRSWTRSSTGDTILHEHDVSAVAGEREWEFKHIADPGRRLRAAAEGPPRRAPRALRRLDQASSRTASEEFVEILAYHLEQACLLAREVGRSRRRRPSTRGSRSTAPGRREGRAPRGPSRGASLLHPGSRPRGRRRP